MLLFSFFTFVCSIAFAQPGALLFHKGNDLWVMNTNGGSQTLLVPNSRSGRIANGLLVYRSNDILYRRLLASESTGTLIPNTNNPWEFDLRQDGQKLAITFAGSSPGTNNLALFTMNLDGTGKVLISQNGLHQLYPTFGGDGYIYFGQSTVGNPYTQQLLRIPEAGVNNPVQLTNVFSQYPQRGGTLGKVLYSVNVSPSALWLMNSDGTSQSAVPNLSSGVCPKAAFDSTQNVIYYQRGDSIRRIAADGFGDTLLTSGLTECTDLSFGLAPQGWPGSTPAGGTIRVTTNLSQSTFTISGPQNYNGSGVSVEFTNAPAGAYTIQYGTVLGYVTPPSQTLSLSNGGNLQFQGTYLIHGPVVTLQASPQPLEFELTQGGTATSQRLNVSTTGTEQYDVLLVAQENWISLANSTVRTGNSVLVEVNPAQIPSAPGTYEGSIELRPMKTGVNSLYVTVRLRVNENPKPIVVIVPGTYGSKLREGDRVPWLSWRSLGPLLSARLLGDSIAQVQALPGLNDLGRLTPENALNIDPGLGLDGLNCTEVGLYTNVISAVICSYYLDFYSPLYMWLKNSGYAPQVFAYDWRKEISSNSERLDGFIRDIQSQNPGRKVALIGHSQGGLVIGEFLRRFGSSQRGAIEPVILLGVPFQGLMMSYNSILGWQSPLNTLFDACAAKALSAIPSAYQMLPRYIGFGGNTSSLPGFGQLNSSLLSQWYQLSAASDSHREIWPKSYAIVGTGIATPAWASANNGVEIKLADGDETVPVVSAQGARWVSRFRYVRGVKHADLPRDSTVTCLIKEMLGDAPDCFGSVVSYRPPATPTKILKFDQLNDSSCPLPGSAPTQIPPFTYSLKQGGQVITGPSDPTLPQVRVMNTGSHLYLWSVDGSDIELTVNATQAFDLNLNLLTVSPEGAILQSSKYTKQNFTAGSTATLDARTSNAPVMNISVPTGSPSQIQPVIDNSNPEDCARAAIPSTSTLGTAAAQASLNLTAPTSCQWTAQSRSRWITADSQQRQGNASASLQIESNPDPLPRTGSVVAGGQRTVLLQKGSSTAKVFQDVAVSDGFHDFIVLLKENGITQGCTATNFCPDQMTTRGQMAAFIIRAVLGSDTFPYVAQPYFQDVPPTHTFFRHIQKMRELGITSGCSATAYCPDQVVTRAQMAAFLVRAKLGISGGQAFPHSGEPYFTDVPLGHPFFAYIQRLRQMGITLGCSATSFCEADGTSRSQMAAFLSRAFLAQ